MWWNGRHGGLKILWCLHRAGSSPATGTTSSRTAYRSRRRFIFQSKRHLSLIPSLILSAKSHARLTCPVVNALATLRCRYRLFAGSNLSLDFLPASLFNACIPNNIAGAGIARPRTANGHPYSNKLRAPWIVRGAFPYSFEPIARFYYRTARFLAISFVSSVFLKTTNLS